LKYKSAQNVKNITFYDGHIIYQDIFGKFGIIINRDSTGIQFSDKTDIADIEAMMLFIETHQNQNFDTEDIKQLLSVVYSLNKISNIDKFGVFHDGIFCITESGDMYIINHDDETSLFYKNVKNVKYENGYLLILTKDDKLLVKFDFNTRQLSNNTLVKNFKDDSFINLISDDEDIKVEDEENCIELASNVMDFTFYFDAISQDYNTILISHLDRSCYLYFFDRKFRFINRMEINTSKGKIIQFGESSYLSVYCLSENGDVYSLLSTTDHEFELDKVYGVENVKRIQYTRGTGDSFFYLQE
jgi:hypothetical protein